MKSLKRWLLILLVFLLWGCASAPEEKNLNLMDTMNYIDENYINTFTTQMNDSDFYTMFSLDPSQISQQVYYQAFLDVKCDEIAMIRVTDETLIPQVESVLQGRLQEVVSEFNGYIDDQYSIASNGIVFSRGTYVFLIIHENATQIQDYLIHELEN